MFTFHIHTERLASCNHAHLETADLESGQNSGADGTMSIFCPRCHAVSEFNLHLVCTTCYSHLAG